MGEPLNSFINLIGGAKRSNLQSGEYEREIRFFNVKNNEFSKYGVSRGIWLKVREWGKTQAALDVKTGTQTFASFQLETRIMESETDKEDTTYRKRTVTDFKFSNPKAEKLFAEKSQDKILKKTRVETQDLINYGMRFSISYEAASHEKKLKFEPNKMRSGKRYSYSLLDHKLRLDLSEISSSDEKGKTNYEIELELLEDVDVGNLRRYLLILLGIIQETSNIYAYQLRDAVIADYNRLIRSTSKDGSMSLEDLVQPRNLKFRDLTWGNMLGGPYSYAVSFKADGSRRIMYFHGSGIWLLHPPFVCNFILPIRQTLDPHEKDFYGFLMKLAGSVIDGELVPKKNQRLSEPQKFTYMFVAFDLVTIYGRVDEIWANNYSDRIDALEKFAREFGEAAKRLPGQLISLDFLIKKIRSTYSDALVQPGCNNEAIYNWPPTSQFFTSVRGLFETEASLKYQTDGLIFTPINAPYRPRKTHLALKDRLVSIVPDTLKWKEPNQLTVDFAVKNHKLYSWSTVEDFEGSRENPFQMRQLKTKTKGTDGKIHETSAGIYRVVRNGFDLNIISLSESGEVSSASESSFAWNRGNTEFSVRYSPFGLAEPYDPEKGLSKGKRVIISGGHYVEFKGRFGIPFDVENEVEWNHPDLRELPDNAVVEFRWHSMGKFIPVRVREEKPYPNSFEITEEIWGLLRDPITKPSIEGYDYTWLRKSHNQVKARLYEKLSEGDRVLEVGFGKAGDWEKLIKARVSEVLAIEPDEENWREAESRIAARGAKIPIKILKKKAEDVSLDEVPKNHFDAVSLMLCLSHFDDRTLPILAKLIDHALKPGGKILIFTIDGDSVREAFHSTFGHDRTHHEVLSFGQVKIKNLGEKINIFFPGAKTVKGGENLGQEENLFSFFSLYKELPGSTLGYTVETFERAGQEPFLPACQYSFSRLYIYSVMKKSEYTEKFRAAAEKKRGKKKEESDEEEEETVEDPKVKVRDGVLGKVRLIPPNMQSAPFWGLLLEAISPSFSKSKNRKDFLESFLEELTDKLYGKDDKELARYQKEMKALGIEKKEEFANSADQIQGDDFLPKTRSDFLLLRLLLGVNIFLLKIEEDELVYKYIDKNESNLKGKKCILFCQDNGELKLVGELIGDKYKTIFILDPAETPVERTLAKKLGYEVEESEESESESEEEETPKKGRKKVEEESEESE